MADLLMALSLMFAGAALALGGFALGQSVERRRWLEWTRPRRPGVTPNFLIQKGAPPLPRSSSFRIEKGAGPAFFIKFPKGWGRRDA